MEIIITGANGFVGAALCRYMHQAGHKVIGVGRQPEPPAQLRQYASYKAADITQIMPDFAAEVCIHAGALASDTASFLDLYAANVSGTANVLQAARNCSYFIQISSSSVYAFGNKPMQEHEATLEKKLSRYGTTKLIAERLLEISIPAEQKRLILRPRAIYGLGDRVLLPRLLNLVKNNKQYLPVPPAVQTSLTHVDNIGYAINLFLQNQNQPALQIFNVADEPHYNLRETIIRVMAAVYPKPIKKIQVPVAIPKLLVWLNKYLPINPQLNSFALSMLTQSAVLDISIIKKEFGYNPVQNLNATLLNLSRWINDLGGVQEYVRKQITAP